MQKPNVLGLFRKIKPEVKMLKFYEGSTYLLTINNGNEFEHIECFTVSEIGKEKDGKKNVPVVYGQSYFSIWMKAKTLYVYSIPNNDYRTYPGQLNPGQDKKVEISEKNMKHRIVQMLFKIGIEKISFNK